MIIKGWMSKRVFEHLDAEKLEVWDGEITLPEVYTEKSDEEYWDNEDWPPVQVQLEIKSI